MNLIRSKPEATSVKSMDLLRPYTVHYLDEYFHRYEYCCYAFNKDHARLSAIEMVQHIHEDPSCIKWIFEEREDFDW